MFQNWIGDRVALGAGMSIEISSTSTGKAKSRRFSEGRQGGISALVRGVALGCAIEHVGRSGFTSARNGTDGFVWSYPESIEKKRTLLGREARA